MYFNKIDICEAWYLALADCHLGQGSPEYARLSRLQRYFRPRPSLSVDTLNDNSRQIYAVACMRLIHQHIPDHLNLDELHDFVASHGYGPPTAQGYILGIQLLAAGDDIATAAAEVSVLHTSTELAED